MTIKEHRANTLHADIGGPLGSIYNQAESEDLPI